MIIVVSHQNPDFDSIASMVAVQKIYPVCKMVIVGTPEENVQKFIDDFSSTFSFFTEKMIPLDDVTTLILVDTQSPSRIGKFSKLLDKKDIQLHIYDHHPQKKIYKNIQKYICEELGSATTILTKIIMEEKINLRPEEATLMMLGIYEETGGLRYVSTTPDDMEASANLLRFGADINMVNLYITHKMDIERTRILSQFLATLESVMIHGFKIYIMTASFNHYVKDISFLIHKVREIENIGIVFALVEMEGKIHLIARSNHRFVDVSAVATHFGGGGHPSASSAVIQQMPLAETKEKLIAFLQSNIKKQYTAQDIMTYPVKYISEETKVFEAKDIMIKSNLNTLPVVKKNRLIGIITRMDLDKAVFHQFSESRIKHYMSIDLIKASPNTSLSEIQHTFNHNNIGRLPIIDKEQLVGIITRTDLLRAMHNKYNEDFPKETNYHITTKILRKHFEQSVPPKIMSVIRKISDLADQFGFSVYLVGGFVRDLIMGIENFDIDIVVETDGIGFTKVLSDYYGTTYVTHKKFATGVVKISNEIKIDIATARSEYYESPGALPTIELASIKHDLSRRDFTINAMTIKLNQDGFGELIDFFNGQQDIKNKKIRVLHNLSFIEDPTRIFRAIRFEQRLGFDIDKHTKKLIKHAVDSDLFDQVAYQRIRDELIDIFNETKPVKAIKRMYQFDELKFIHPVFASKKIDTALFEKIDNSITWFKLSFFKINIHKWIVYFMGMVAKLPISTISTICERMKIQTKYTENIISTIKTSHRVLPALEKNIKKDSFLYRLLLPFSTEGLLLLMSLSDKKAVRKKISYYLTYLKNTKLQVSGKDIIKYGLKPSVKFNKILNLILMEKLDKKVTGIEQEQNRLKDLAQIYKKHG